ALGVVASSLPRSRGRCLRLGRARRRGALDDYCHCPYRRMARAMFRAASSSACFELFFWYTASSTAFCMIVWYTSSAAGFVLIDRPYFSMIDTNCCSCGSVMYPVVRSDLRGGMKYIVSLYFSRLSLSATNWMNFQDASGCLLCFEMASQSVQLVVTCCFLPIGSATTRLPDRSGVEAADDEFLTVPFGRLGRDLLQFIPCAGSVVDARALQHVLAVHQRLRRAQDRHAVRLALIADGAPGRVVEIVALAPGG